VAVKQLYITTDAKLSMRLRDIRTENSPYQFTKYSTRVVGHASLPHNDDAPYWNFKSRSIYWNKEAAL